jgi:hypothetical protein
MLVDIWHLMHAGYFSYGWGPCSGMFTYTPGEVAIYSIAAVDSTGAPLLGGNNYRLHLPANIPAKLFCHVTLPKPAQHSDRSTDLYFFTSVPTPRKASLAQNRTQQGLLRCSQALFSHRGWH